MAQAEKTIYVYENWRGETPSLLGTLRAAFIRGQEASFAFSAFLTRVKVMSEEMLTVFFVSLS